MTGATVKPFLIEQCPECDGRGGPGLSTYPPCDRCVGIGQTYTEAPDHRIIGPDQIAALGRVLELLGAVEGRSPRPKFYDPMDDLTILAAIGGEQ